MLWERIFLDVDSIFSGFSLPDGLCSSLTFESVKNMDNSLMRKTGRAEQWLPRLIFFFF